jgi:hypothetical protein
VGRWLARQQQEEQGQRQQQAVDRFAAQILHHTCRADMFAPGVTCTCLCCRHWQPCKPLPAVVLVPLLAAIIKQLNLWPLLCNLHCCALCSAQHLGRLVLQRPGQEQCGHLRHTGASRLQHHHLCSQQAHTSSARQGAAHHNPTRSEYSYIAW